MKQHIRIIRISFFVCAVLAVGAFWAGFYFGSTSFQGANLVTENTTGIYSAQADAEDPDGKEEDLKTDSLKTDAVESMNTLSPDKYYLKKNGSFLSVYKGTSDSVYFDTNLKADSLPEELQKEAENGIEFDNLEEVYGFLENYSS